MSELRRVKVQPPSTEKIIFWSVAALLLIQLVWWISFQIRESKRLQDAQIKELRAGRAQAWMMDNQDIVPSGGRGDTWMEGGNRLIVGEIVGPMPRFRPIGERKAGIERAFPHVAVVERPVEVDDPTLFTEEKDGRAWYLTLRRDVLAKLERERRMALWWVAAQASALVSMVLLGMVYIYRRLNVEMDLMLRQRNFIAAVTHELKTPIASLRVWIETLFTRTLPEERRQRIQHLMEGDLTRLTGLVTNLLDVARADAGRLEVMAEPVDFGPWIRGVAEAMDHRLGQGGLGLSLDVAEGVWVNIDPRLFATVLENLLSNAFKYSDEPRNTSVTMVADGDWATLSVADRGRGFHPKEVGRLFQRFYRVGDEMTRQVAGTGLGLFLSREIVQRHYGTILAHSLGKGLGATFTVRIPRLPR